MAQRRARLDRETVLRGACSVLDEVGLDRFTTRALAVHLDVRQPALYWHFPAKKDLLQALAADVLKNEHHASIPEPGEEWRTFLLRNARSFRAALHAVRDGARLHAEYHRRPSSDGLDGLDGPTRQVALLTAQGIDQRTAVHALMALGRYTVGVVLEEQADEDGALAQQPEADAAFEYGLSVLVAGITPDPHRPCEG